MGERWDAVDTVDAVGRSDVILVIDDEIEIRRAVAGALTNDATRVVEAPTATAGIEAAIADHPNLVVLDLGLPDRPGIEVCRELRRWLNVPIVVLSARVAEADRIALLRAGADDYVTKPFNLADFVARVQAQLRRSQSAGHDAAQIIELDGLAIDLSQRRVSREQNVIRLAPIEYLILQTLALHAGRPVTQQQLLEVVWGPTSESPQQYLGVYVTQLRRKVELDPANPRVVVTEPGVGYRFGRVVR
jgi:two-component system KDP operon response regulator KdpE